MLPLPWCIKKVLFDQKNVFLVATKRVILAMFTSRFFLVFIPWNTHFLFRAFLELKGKKKFSRSLKNS